MDLENTNAGFIVYFIVYGGASVAALIAFLYLWLRKCNAFAAGINTPIRLRRWAAAFFALTFLGHIWWLLFYIYSGNINSVGCMLLATLDCVGLMTTIPGTLLAMLQDRERSVWPIVLAIIPYAVFLGLNVAYPDHYFFNMAILYVLLVYLAFTIYMVFAVKKYGRWLRDNYADLEHKEVLYSHVMVIVILLLIITYGFDGDNITISYIVQITEIPLFGLLLWRVETLPQLENSPVEQQPVNIPSNLEQLLDERCVGTLLYLQHDLTLQQLAQAIGTNRYYLSQYFSRQGITYNAYINNLRINHFVNLYHESVAARQQVTAQQLASDSGYRSYSTFSLAFKQRMGQSVTAWMRETDK